MNPIIINHQGLGALWTIGWLFTIGYLDLSFWKGVLALIIWPVYIGKKFRKPAMGGGANANANGSANGQM